MILTFFEKVENTKAEMDAKFNSKTCLEKAFFPIVSPFMRIKGTVARDFRPLVFFMNQPHMDP